MGVVTAPRTAFCTRCGAGLVDGSCPDHGSINPGPTTVVERVRPSWIVVTAAVIGLVLVGALLSEVRSTSRRQRRLTREQAASVATVKSLSERMRALEGRAADQLDVAAVAKKVEPSVVTVEDSEGGVGSGFALRFSAPNTEIVTNFHVVERDWKKGKKDVKVRQPGREVVGRVVTVNASADLAVIHVSEMLPVLQRAPGAPSVGDPVIVVGSPLRLDNTVSTGIVSAIRDEFLQFSAPVSPGNSGGPVVDRTGRVIGVTRAKEAGLGVEGLSFAIPIAVVCSSLSIC